MLQIIFTAKEKELIASNLENRLKEYRKNGNLYKRKSKEVEETLVKINSETDDFYRSTHKLQVISVTNEFLSVYRIKINEFRKPQVSQFIELEHQDRADLMLIDLCYGILEKTGDKKSKFRFEDVLQKIIRLKNCEKICLSRVDGDNIYKIAFVDKEGVMNWEMGDTLNILKAKFSRLSRKETSRVLSTYTDHLSKNEARKLISEIRLINFSDDTLKFTKYLLN